MSEHDNVMLAECVAVEEVKAPSATLVTAVSEACALHTDDEPYTSGDSLSEEVEGGYDMDKSGYGKKMQGGKRQKIGARLSSRLGRILSGKLGTAW